MSFVPGATYVLSERLMKAASSTPAETPLKSFKYSLLLLFVILTEEMGVIRLLPSVETALICPFYASPVGKFI